MVSIDEIDRHDQVRTVFDEGELEALAASIKENGALLEPVVLSKKRGGGYDLIAGERRIRGAEIAGLKKVEAVFKKVAPEDVTLVQLEENLQREALGDMDLGNAFAKVMADKGISAVDLAKRLMKSKSFVVQRVALTKPKVHESVRTALAFRDIEFAAARALMTLPLAEQEEALKSSIEQEAEARKARDEKKPKIALMRPPEEPQADETEASADAPADGSAGDDGAPADDAPAAETVDEEVEEPARAARRKRKGKEPKASTKAVKREVKRRKRSASAKKAPAASTRSEELFEEKFNEWVPEFVDADTGGKGLEDGMSAVKVRNLLKRFGKFLLTDKRALILRA